MSLANSFIAFLVAADRAKPDPSASRISALEVENIRLRSAVSELRARLAAAQAPAGRASGSVWPGDGRANVGLARGADGAASRGRDGEPGRAVAGSAARPARRAEPGA